MQQREHFERKKYSDTKKKKISWVASKSTDQERKSLAPKAIISLDPDGPEV